MNKGRNIMILMCCLLLLGLLTFLARTKANNYSAVVDDVRYIMKGAEDNVKNYEFYFKDDKVMVGKLIHTAECSQLQVSVRGEYNEDLQEYYTEPYEYTYKIYGTNKDNSYVKWEYTDTYSQENVKNKPHEIFTADLMRTMMFGEEPFISIFQAFVIGVIALFGGLIIGKAEELWHILYRKGEDQIPAWEDMTGIKRVGIGVLIFDAVLLIVFIAL